LAESLRCNSTLESERGTLIAEINKLKAVMEEKMKLQKERDEMQNKLKELNGRITSTDKVTESLRQEIEAGVQEIQQMKQHAQEQESTHQQQLSKLEALENDCQSLQEQVSSLAAAAAAATAQLRDAQQQLEAAKSAAPVVSTSDTPQSAPELAPEEVTRLSNAKENAERQIDFLNTVIVELQLKNDQLKEQLEADLNDSSYHAPDSPLKPSVARLYCDICEEFDQHDTEDCALQESDSPDAPTRRPAAASAAERPYCDVCEAFGHSTLDCDDEVTF